MGLGLKKCRKLALISRLNTDLQVSSASLLHIMLGSDIFYFSVVGSLPSQSSRICKVCCVGRGECLKYQGKAVTIRKISGRLRLEFPLEGWQRCHQLSWRSG
jgi:hypothetical protein